jgi:hypothetical protein
MIRSLDDLVRLRDGGLRNLWMRGSVPSADELTGWVFRGWNTSFAAARSPVGGRAFAKGFFREGDTVGGCNFMVRVRDGAWQIDTDHPFGFFAAYASAESRAWSGWRPALLLDYGRGAPGREIRGSPRLRLRIVSWLARPLQDLIVRPPDAADGLYVGWAFLSPAVKLPVTCFALERWRPLSAPAAERAVA